MSDKKTPDFKVGDKVSWKTGRAPRIMPQDIVGTVQSPPRAKLSGETIYVEWPGHGTLPCSMHAVTPVAKR
ncbi:hypothetical protein CKO28_04675 [Rhodovibrio sodomensis]|uniref:Hypervirulence associated protein TUDOR domain-containing protein n=1 Tax=Rhodovibrio sodomensis TaxID=1088 RepID=A0ABS1DB28_9PROT|nr:hypothetical protein [Rhodovibrio sodomensis]MBK1667322.1 hypothetical protein [Rhodovibrio sodomensis]